MCTINKSAHTKKSLETYGMPLVYGWKIRNERKILTRVKKKIRKKKKKVKKMMNEFVKEKVNEVNICEGENGKKN